MATRCDSVGTLSGGSGKVRPSSTKRLDYASSSLDPSPAAEARPRPARDLILAACGDEAPPPTPTEAVVATEAPLVEETATPEEATAVVEQATPEVERATPVA